MQEKCARQQKKSKVRNDENDFCANFGVVRFDGGQFCEHRGSDDDFGGKRRNARKCDDSDAAARLLRRGTNGGIDGRVRG